VNLPPDPEDVQLDFSQWHPLDHWSGTARCRTLYGGWRWHLRIAWEFKWRGQLRTHTLCKLGRHGAYVSGYSRAPGTQRGVWLEHWPVCPHCYAPKPGLAAEASAEE
jgi:hypothetical protein